MLGVTRSATLPLLPHSLAQGHLVHSLNLRDSIHHWLNLCAACHTLPIDHHPLQQLHQLPTFSANRREVITRNPVLTPVPPKLPERNPAAARVRRLLSAAPGQSQQPSGFHLGIFQWSHQVTDGHWWLLMVADAHPMHLLDVAEEWDVAPSDHPTLAMLHPNLVIW